MNRTARRTQFANEKRIAWREARMPSAPPAEPEKNSFELFAARDGEFLVIDIVNRGIGTVTETTRLTLDTAYGWAHAQQCVEVLQAIEAEAAPELEELLAESQARTERYE